MNFFVKHSAHAQVEENLVQQVILSEAASELHPEGQHVRLILIHATQKISATSSKDAQKSNLRLIRLARTPRLVPPKT